MGRMWIGPLALTLMTAAGACEGVNEPANEVPRGIDFGLATGQPGSHSAQGSLAASGTPLDGEFAVAVPDSLGGLVLVSYDAASSDLFILQVVSAVPGSHTCGPVEAAAMCHGRVFENVRFENGVVEVGGRFDLVEGSLTIESVGPTEVVGTFRARLDRTHPEGAAGSIDVEQGTIRVNYVDQELAKGGLNCLIALAGGNVSCDGA